MTADHPKYIYWNDRLVAWDDATVYAIHEQERAGLDIITDGEMRRESYSNRFATALDGVDMDNHGTALDRSGEPVPVPRVIGEISRRHAVQVRDVQFLRQHTDRMIKITVPGPFTMSQQAQDDYYNDPEALAVAYGRAVNGEIKDLFAAGADVVQLDEPYMQARPDKSLILDPNEFYILASKEAVQVPPNYAAEMVPFDPLVGEFRVHYAGFFDPGFGYAGAGGKGARAVLEVRSREVPFILEHGQIVGRLVYEKMLAKPEKLYGQGIGSNYQAQSLKLSKHFKS